MKTKILVILGSTRKGRRGGSVANWAMDILSKKSDVEFELVDLKKLNLPFFDFPIPPSVEKGKYFSALQEKWAKKVDSADGFLIITPEYNHGYPGVLKNALDFLWYEWNGKPVTFISYGGLSGGLRAVEQLRQVAIELEMIPIRESVAMPKIRMLFDDKGKITDDSYDERLASAVDFLLKWTKPLKKIRKALEY